MFYESSGQEKWSFWHELIIKTMSSGQRSERLAIENVATNVNILEGNFTAVSGLPVGKFHV